MYNSDIRFERVRYYRGSRIVKMGIPHVFTESAVSPTGDFTNDRTTFHNRSHVLVEQGRSFYFLKTQEFSIVKLDIGEPKVEPFSNRLLDISKEHADLLVDTEQCDTYNNHGEIESILNPIAWEAHTDEIESVLLNMRLRGIDKDLLRFLQQYAISKLLYEAIDNAIRSTDAVKLSNVVIERPYDTPVDFETL